MSSTKLNFRAKRSQLLDGLIKCEQQQKQNKQGEKIAKTKAENIGKLQNTAKCNKRKKYKKKKHINEQLRKSANCVQKKQKKRHFKARFKIVTSIWLQVCLHVAGKSIHTHITACTRMCVCICICELVCLPICECCQLEMNVNLLNQQTIVCVYEYKCV